MVIEVTKNVFGEVMTRTSNLRKRKIKLGEKLTTQGQGPGHCFHPVKIKFDGR